MDRRQAPGRCEAPLAPVYRRPMPSRDIHVEEDVVYGTRLDPSRELRQGHGDLGLTRSRGPLRTCDPQRGERWDIVLEPRGRSQFLAPADFNRERALNVAPRRLVRDLVPIWPQLSIGHTDILLDVIHVSVVLVGFW